MNSQDVATRQSALEMLQERLRKDGRTDSEIARWAGISQPTVSRLRGNTKQRQRMSKPFNKLCSMYAVGSVHGTESGSDYNALLGAAVAAAWDGTADTGKNLLALIEALNRLINRGTRNQGRSHGRN